MPAARSTNARVRGVTTAKAHLRGRNRVNSFNANRVQQYSRSPLVGKVTDTTNALLRNLVSRLGSKRSLGRYRRGVHQGAAKFQKSFTDAIQFRQLPGLTGHVVETGRAQPKLRGTRRKERATTIQSAQPRRLRARPRFNDTLKAAYAKYLHPLRPSAQLRRTPVPQFTAKSSRNRRRYLDALTPENVTQRQGVRRTRALAARRFLSQP